MFCEFSINVWLLGKCEIKCRAFVDLAVSPDSSAVPVDYALDNRQADARSFKLLGAMQPLKNAKKLVRVVHIKPDSVILDVVNLFAILTVSVYVNHYGLLRL